MNLQKDAEQGRQAELLLDNEIYKDSIALLKSSIVSAWENCPVRDVEGQHELKLMLKLLKDLENNIQQVATTGKLARLQIERDKTGIRGFFNAH